MYPTLVGKGYVLYNSTVSVDSGVTAYYARRATSVSSAESNNAYYYDQAALVNVDFTGSGSLASAHWYVGNTPNGVTDGLYGSYADVGWKEYGVTQDSTAVSTSGSSYGVITSAEYSAEYSGRRAILNRFYNITGKAYERDTDTNFAVDKLISSRGYNVTSDLSAETVAGVATTTSVIYDFTALSGYTAQSSQVESVSASSSGASGDDISLSSSSAIWKWWGTSYGLASSGSSPWKMTIPVTGACTITITNSYNSGNITRDGDDADAYPSGGIIGMGETFEDRIDMALSLHELNIRSIPINALMAIPGTPFENLVPLSEDEILRTLAMFRFINPEANIRLAAGRKLLSENGKKAFESGCSATITGNMLTTSGSTIKGDIEMLTNIGRTIKAQKGTTCDSCDCSCSGNSCDCAATDCASSCCDDSCCGSSSCDTPHSKSCA